MFDDIARPGRRRSGRATAAAIAAHGAAIAIAVLLASVPDVDPTRLPEVRVLPPRFTTLQTGGRNGTSQPPRPPDRSANKPKPLRLSVSRELLPARVPPEESVPEPARDSEPGPGAADAQGIGDRTGRGGEQASTTDVPGGTLEYQAEKMTPPRQISGPDPEYTPQALQNDVQGLMVVKCVVTVEGAVHGCRVLQGLPFLNRAVVEALEQRRYIPARLSDGRPVEVEYTFRIRLELPQ